MVTRDGYIAVYIMASGVRGTLYIGVTSDLITRVYQHREGLMEGFTKTYGCKRLVWYAPDEIMTEAIQREKSLKRYPRDWKLNLIERDNPDWIDLYPVITGQVVSGPRQI
jgi:putative endonuclease